MDCIKVDMRISVDKFYIEENNALGEMKNLASEIQIKQFKGILTSKEQKLRRLTFPINKMKGENNTNQEQAGKIPVIE